MTVLHRDKLTFQRWSRRVRVFNSSHAASLDKLHGHEWIWVNRAVFELQTPATLKVEVQFWQNFYDNYCV